MKKLDFKNFEIYTGVSKQKTQEGDARESFADVIYTRANGIRAADIAMKIYKSDGVIEFDDTEINLIQAISCQYCSPAFAESLNRQIELLNK